MSNPARYPDYSHSRYPGSGGYPGHRARPVPTPQWPGWPTPGPAGLDAGAYHHAPPHPLGDTVGYTPADGWHPGPATHSTTWAIPPMPEHPWGLNTPAKPTPLFGQWAHGPQADPSPYYEDFGLTIDHQQRRMKWRDELLKGDPEKAINDSLPEATRLVITFITRGSPSHPHGQGEEILRFRLPSRTHQFSTTQDLRRGWKHFTMDASALFKIKEDDVMVSADDLSTRAYSYLFPNLDVKKDLKLVRRSKPLLWDNTTLLEAFLYRIVPDKEDPESEGGKDLAERLGGPSVHGWYAISDISPMNSHSDLVCTALTAVCLPPLLSLALDSIFADQESRAEQLALKALEVLYLCIQTKHARLAFKFYPIPPPPPDQPDHILCEKRRIWAYWTEVLAWHLSQLREDAQVSTSYALVETLSAVKNSVDDPKISLDELDNIMVTAIASEADRSRYASGAITHEAVGECLHNPAFMPETSSEKMHIITAGTSSIVFNVITRLIFHVLDRKMSAAGSSHPSSVIRRIMDLRITIAEARPLSEGVVLATKLARAVDSYMERRDRTTKQTRRSSAVPSATELGGLHLDAQPQSRLIKPHADKERMQSPMMIQPSTMGLSQLLENWDAKREKKEPKVTIELITDSAVVSTTMASAGCGIKPIVLLSADRILPNGDSVNKVGSAQMAWAASSSGGVVLILSRADRVHSKDLPAPAKPSGPSEELITGWKSTMAEEALVQMQGSSSLTISNPIYEDVDHNHITAYITELGLMQLERLTEFSVLRSGLERVVWPVNALSE